MKNLDTNYYIIWYNTVYIDQIETDFNIFVRDLKKKKLRLCIRF